MDRAASLQRLLARPGPWDVAVIGGGATGVGVAVDAASRGYAVCLFEQSDFGKGTSSRSTKLVHGGVRYLRQGNVALVTAALRERAVLRRNAPHLVHERAFVVPSYGRWERPYYGMGLKLYDLLAGRRGLGKSRLLSREEALRHVPTLETRGLRGGVLYYDGQFDDARLLVALARTADAHGAALLNYAPVTALTRDAGGRVDGLAFLDAETGESHAVRARCVVNATGPFCDAVRRLDDAGAARVVTPSQGAHVVLDHSFLPGDAALMVPRTRDGRVMFAIPWQGHALLGTTDTAVAAAVLEPVPMEREVDFLLETAGKYLSRPPGRRDVLSAFAGVRPLVKASSPTRTASLSRDHTIEVSKSGLLTITGGKWTTYRKMAEDCVDRAAAVAGLAERPCVTRTLKVYGYHDGAGEGPADLRAYGSDAAAVRALAGPDPRPLHEALPITAAQVVWAVRHEMARTVDDVLARRTRALPLNARAAIEMAPKVAGLMAAELGRDSAWEAQHVREFGAIARNYLVTPPTPAG